MGKVFSKGNIEPFHTYLVNGEWVMNLVQAGMMDVQVARGDVIKLTKELPRLLQNLDTYVSEREWKSCAGGLRKSSGNSSGQSGPSALFQKSRAGRRSALWRDLDIASWSWLGHRGSAKRSFPSRSSENDARWS